MSMIRPLSLLPLRQALALLKQYRIPVCKQELVSSKIELLYKTRQLSYPLVLKAFTEAHSHKTEAGLVYLDLHNEGELLNAFRELSKKTARLSTGFLVQEYLPGVEFIIGGKKDEVFGQTILFGSGGVLAELLDDVSVRVTPIAAAEAKEMISETKAHLFFTPRGFRGKKASGRKIIELLLAV